MNWIVIYLVASSLFILGIYVLVRYFNFRHQLHQDTCILELIPPAFVRKAPLATEHLLVVLHKIYSEHSYKDRLLGRHKTLSFEVISTRKQGIRYVVRLNIRYLSTFQKQLEAYLPSVRYKRVADYSEGLTESHLLLMNFMQARHFAFPLANHDSLVQHDPIAYIAGSMTKLLPGELIAFQIVLRPTYPRHVNSIRSKLLTGKDPHLYNKNRPFLMRAIVFLLLAPFKLIKLVFSTLNHFHDRTLPSQKYYQELALAMKTHSEGYRAFLSSISDKLAQPLFQTNVRILVADNDLQRAERDLLNIKASLASFDVPGYQGLIMKRKLRNSPLYKYYWLMFSKRLLSTSKRCSCVLSASEVASLYHFPYGDTALPENLVSSHSRTLPAPVSLKNGTHIDITLGENQHHGTTTKLGLTTEERERHVYIVGGTGNGKTTMLQYAIIQDIRNGNGLAVVDPHGDMAETILRHVTQNRIKDVIYFNPDDLDYPVGMNLLEMPPGLEGNALIREKDLITESVISVFRKIFSEEAEGGHRIEYVLRNAIHTALTVEGATLFTVLRLLQNSTYRKKITSQLEDEDLKDFWKSEFGRAGNMQRVKMSAGITSKIGRFNSNASAKLILGQEKSTINFDHIINTGKILICNFSKGLLGEDVSELFGITVLAKIQLASLRRARIQQSQRKPFYLYVDEFQNFATTSFIQMLSESRKYKLFMTIAEQSTSQQKDQKMVSVILANVGTVICFRTGNPDDERIMLPLFRPYIEVGEIANLSAFNFYARISSLFTQEPLSGKTIMLDGNGSELTIQSIIAYTRQNYSLEYNLGKTKNTVPDGEEELASPIIMSQERASKSLKDGNGISLTK